MSNPTELPDERAEFESAQRKYHWPLAEADLRQDKIGNYYNHVTQANWSMWSARAALARRAQPEGEAPQAEAFAWAVFAENGNVIIWSKKRSEVEAASEKYALPVVPVIAISAAQHAESGASSHTTNKEK